MNGNLLTIILPELLLTVAACILFLLGVSRKRAARRLAPMIALLALVIAFAVQIGQPGNVYSIVSDSSGAIHLSGMGIFVKMLACVIGGLVVLLAWPTDPDATGNSALQYGADAAGEFFALLLLSIAGIFVVVGANDVILLFLGIELASIPTYIMVSISRPLPAAQEAGVKYFFLGAMSAAILLLGFSYLYGSTGVIDLHVMSEYFAARGRTAPISASSWEMLGIVLVMMGLSFKLAAVPLHFYAPDVYEGAATPVTALLSFVPKTSGLIALIKVLWMVGGGTWQLPPSLVQLIAVMAVLTMTVGNVLGLMQHNIKRVLACSSIAHSGYLLVGVSALVSGTDHRPALAGLLFYLAAYGLMNVAAFGVLMLLPSRGHKPATSAETFEDLAGTGQNHVILGLAMAVACFSLTGLPFTVGFWGKAFLIFPALRAGNTGLVVIMMINAAISAGYYLKIVGVMFLRPLPQGGTSRKAGVRSTPVGVAVALATLAVLVLGIILPTTEMLRTQALQSVEVDSATAPTANSAQP